MLATTLDLEMFTRIGAPIGPPDNGHNRPPPRPGTEVARELGGRFLLRYLRPDQVGRYTEGTSEETFVSPTPYAPTESIPWLNLPFPTIPRTHVLFLDAAAIPLIQGPMWTAYGKGLQYILLDGFPKEAIVVPGAPTAVWEIMIR